jgi:hypothetical protein
MPLLTPHDEYSMAQLIERHIEFYRVDAKGNERTVALNPVFVRHYMHCRDSKLPVVTTIVTSPLVLPNGELLATQGLDRKRGIVFRLQPELVALLPTSEECTLSEVTKAMRFLTDEWLCDVATDYSGKCVIIAAALTISRTRSLAGAAGILRDRGTARWRQNDDTADVVPRRNRHTRSCSGVSTSEEEIRKCLFAYLSAGVAAVVWDNIPRGATISCPSIEKCLTAALYSDRVLGESETRTVPAMTVVLFTGNNIAPRGDLASRSLQVRLAVDRPDPENRSFTQPDPIAWATDQRGNILRALYTILLGNPRLRAANRRRRKPDSRCGGTSSARPSSTPPRLRRKRSNAWRSTGIQLAP